ncbi:hypothetical protein SMSP2_00516 [Limihaloglobus sulfuriphilus]|uniref:Aldose 1-epimerase n=2 Tax=Limihaloglobus sulfuriphilus TaxID=1851148 RepID=A0A1Q2MBS8_9BACT|nr:hypothetical protein SMSP2_00516 [Limihaloglobus sulfuriphilus]
MDYKDRIINHNQLGGIETYVVDNGPGRGSRVAWVNTGSGLRFKVSIDRGLDIVEAFYGKYSLSWLSFVGTAAPRPDSDRGLNWLSTFPGGLVTTCGLSHAGAPDEDESGQRGLHGKYSNSAAEVTSIIQPELTDAEPQMSISGIVREARVFGPNLEMQRTISCKLLKPQIVITDRVINRGNSSSPHMLLYHCNFGWPLVDQGTQILYKGKCRSRGMDFDDAVFNENNDYRTCSAPIDAHSGSGEACGFIDSTPDDDGLCRTGLFNDKLSLGAMITYDAKQLPCLANWQHWGRGEYVTGLEPATNFPTGQVKAREEGKLIMLEPGETRNYKLVIDITEK